MFDDFAALQAKLESGAWIAVSGTPLSQPRLIHLTHTLTSTWAWVKLSNT